MSTDPMQVFKEAIDKARLDGYKFAIAEVMDFVKSKGAPLEESAFPLQLVEPSTTSAEQPVDEIPEGEPDPKDFIAPPPPKVGKGYCPKCLALKTHCVCNGVGYDCECGECACMKPVRQEGQVCATCRSGNHQE